MRLRIFLFILSFFYAESLFAQSDLEKKYAEAIQLADQNRYTEALQLFEEILQQSPNNIATQFQSSWCAIQLGNAAKAEEYANNALFLDPMEPGALIVKYYVEVLKGNQADQYLEAAIWYSADENVLDGFNKNIDELTKNGFTVFENDRAKTKSFFASRDRSYMPVAQSINHVIELLQKNNITDALSEAKKTLSSCKFPTGMSYVKGGVAYRLGNVFNYFKQWNESQWFFEQALVEWSKSPPPGNYLIFTVAVRLAETYKGNLNWEKAFSLLSSQYEFASKLPSVAVFDQANYFQLICEYYTKDGVADMIKKHAIILSNIKVPGLDYQYYQASSCNFMGIALERSLSSADLKASGTYFEKGMQICNEYGFAELMRNIRSNYALYLFKSGNYAEGIRLTEQSATEDIAAGRYMMAENSYNNLGAMYMNRADYRNAIVFFKKSAELVEKYRDEYKGEDRLNFMARGVSSYNFMVSSYAKLKDATALFEMQNKERGRTLAEMLGNNSLKGNTSLAEFQRSLQPDEAAVIYSVMEAGVVVINLVTPSFTYALENNKIESFVKLKKRHLDRIQKAANKAGYKPVTADIQKSSNYELSYQLSRFDMDDMMQVTRELLQTNVAERLPFLNEFLSVYYDFLIQPIEQRLQGVKKLIIFPSDILNFLPFESLTDGTGKYLVQKVDIRYAQSADVKKLIEGRAYKTRSKSLLAMGGAVYDQMKESSDPIRGADQLVSLQNLATLNVLQNKPQREIYAALGFGKLNYLPGTLNEVKSIEKYFDGKADVYTGTQMTENFIKSLSKSGELKNYRVVHLATHGFALPEIPQLSGIAMCIFPQMQGGEDGYLTAAEISQLNMNADLAVLSACETGLGKIYGGEGVSGLTQALLVGGANRAIVSLWPVSDEGTMYFMNGLYELTQKQGLSYDEAVNTMKRRFISGEFGAAFQLPGIWAPFVHYGK